ncbi:aldehyde reductase, putative [Plasmodium chabaudi chabaudi]|uniref:Aldehyde reductase, putative n=1 Tax=Plasmodium chabaudi chabaudi TaxID=31271 RepID=A0A1D3RZ52_PLACU|nr:aldehyde reductase, putative [Plasmodium chabaudi chabaudi]
MKKYGLKWVYFFISFIVFISISIKCKHVNLNSINNKFPTYKGAICGGNEFRLRMKNDEHRENSGLASFMSKKEHCKINGKKKIQEILRRKPILMYLIKKGTHNRLIKNVEKKVTKIILFTANFNEQNENIHDIVNKKGFSNDKESLTYSMGKDQEDGGNHTSLYNNNINKEDDVTYKYVEEMESKKININGVEINYKIYNLEEGIYLVDNENYEKVKSLWNKDELKKAKENFESSFDIKKQGIKDEDWIMLPLDYDENKNIKLVKADFDNPSYDYILTYYDKERNYYWEYKRRNYYKMFRNTSDEIPSYKSELEEDKRFYSKEIIIPKKTLDNKIFRQPMLSDMLTRGYSKEPIGLESWRYVKYPYGNLIKPQKYSQLYCIKKNGKDKPDMRYHYLGNSNIAVSEICLGTMNFGNYVDEKLAHELFNYAYEEFQVNFFDTAEIYPLPVKENYFGLSEKILGNWIESKGKANRHKFVIATKICGRTDKIPWAKKYKTNTENSQKIMDPQNDNYQSISNKNKSYEQKEMTPLDKLEELKKKEKLYFKNDKEELEKLKIYEKKKLDEERNNNTITLSKENIISSVDNSLKRLKTNYIDLLQLHWPDRYYPNQSSGDYSDVLYDYTKYYDDFVPFVEQLEALDELKKKGKIREWGLSNETPFGVLKFYELCKHLHISPPVSVQLEYNLLCRNNLEKGFPEICRPQNTNISLLAYSPLCAGILTGKYLEYTDYTTKGRMLHFPSYMKRLRGSIATYIIRELYYLSQKYYFPNLTVAALKWVYTRPFITSTIIGVSDFLQLRENLYSLTQNVLFTDKLEREINALHWKFRDPVRIIQ